MKVMLSNATIDIFGVCETFLNQNTDDQTLTMPGYTHERKDRSDYDDISTSANGGGVLIYIRDQLNYVRRHDLESNEIESIWIEIKLKNSTSFLVSFVYRPPSSKAEWSDKLSNQIEKSLAFTNEIYILGDINVDFKDGTYSNTKWKHVVETNDLHQLISKPTRVTAHSETIIVHIYVSTTEYVKDIFVPSISVSDHYLIQFTRSTYKSQFKRHDHKTIQYRSFNSFNEERFLSDLSDAMTALEISQTDSDENFANWTQTFMTIFDKHAPVKSKRVKKEIQPEWLNENIKHATKQRDKNWTEYKYWRNKSTNLIRSAKKEFFSRSIAENKDNAYLWKHIKNLKEPQTSNKLPDELHLDGQVYNNIENVAENLNYFFSTISNKLKSEYPTNNITCDLIKLDNYINTKVPNEVSFCIPLLKPSDLISTIKALDVTKATGLDGLSAKILKTLVDIVAPSLLKIVNISLLQGRFPKSLKIAKINPIHKGGQKSDPSNYRPISVLPILSKVIEKHVTNHLFAYLNKYKILHKSQSSFRKNHSCNTALISLLDKWLKSIDKGEIIGAVFFDLRKAFDVVDHEILLRKLLSHKFDNRSLKWMQSYLSDRKQCIVEKKKKKKKNTFFNAGCKIRSPTRFYIRFFLFLIFINDMPLFINEAYAEVYADDSTVHAANKDTIVVEYKLQNGAVGFWTWCRNNKMFIHRLPKPQ